MRKAKVVAIALGMAAFCLFGGFAAADAATITLDDCSTDVLSSVSLETAITTTVTSIEDTTATTTSTTTMTECTESAETTESSVEETTTEETTATSIEETVLITEETEIVVEQPRETEPPTIVNIADSLHVEQPTAAPATTVAATAAPAAPATTTTTTAATAAPAPAATTTTTTAATTAAPAPATTVATTAAPAPVVNSTEAYAKYISQSDYILLCNAVGHEAGADKISEYNKALVVEVIMNRVNSSKYPNTIYGVLTQKNQFSGSSTYVNLTTYSSKVTTSVKNAVNLYFSDTSQFNHGYLSFSGDGTRNYFR